MKRPYRTLCELSKEYGSVFTVHFGPRKVVVLAGYKTVKQALVNHAEVFGDRGISAMSRDTSNGHGIAFSNGDCWKEMRRFALTNLKDFGMGKKMIEEKIIEECHRLTEVFDKHEGKAFDTTQPVNYAVSNIICAIVYGNRFEYDDPEFTKMVDRAKENMRLAGSVSIQLSKEYGSVFTVHFGPRKVVVLAGYKTVKQALVNHAEVFGDRGISAMSRDTSNGHGIAFSNGDCWKEMRRFALTNLKDFGMGKKMIEEKIIEECHRLTEVFDKHEGKAFDTTQPVNYAVSNIICAIVYGNRFEYDDPEFTKMVDRAKENMRLAGSVSIQLYNMFPWLGMFFNTRTQVLKNNDTNKKQMRNLIRGLKETLNPQMARGFVDSFLTRKQNLEESGKMDTHYHNDNLLATVSNLFVAGTDTTGGTLRWCLILMAKYPHIQDQVQEEISRETGSRQVLVEDRKNLPYTNAVIHETQRLANIAPMSLPHVTSQDVTFQGYFIKEGATVFPLLTSVLQDESEWESPHTFNPNHFLDEQGKFIKKDAFMSFSAGRRACPGESLARMELFLFFTSLLQHFRFSAPPGVTEDDLDLTPAVGFSLNPTTHKLCAVRRL